MTERIPALRFPPGRRRSYFNLDDVARTSSPLCQVRMRSLRMRSLEGSTASTGMRNRAHRREAVAALGPEVGAFVRIAEVVNAEVVAGGDPFHVAPGLWRRELRNVNHPRFAPEKWGPCSPRHICRTVMALRRFSIIERLVLI